MSDFKKNDTTIGDVLSDHFGVTNFREARERRNDAAEKSASSRCMLPTALRLRHLRCLQETRP